MATRSPGAPKALWAVAIIVPIVMAIVVPLYLSGPPAVKEPTEIPAPPAAVATSIVVQIPPTVTAPALAAAVVEPTFTPAATAAPPSPTPTREPARLTAIAEEGETLTGKIDPLIADERGVYGIMVANASGDLLYERNADLPFQAASLYKLVLLADVYAGIESGAVDPNLTLWLKAEYFPLEGEPEDSYYDASWVDAVVSLDDALFATGAYSSNVAARALLSMTDGPSLQAMARRIGMDDTYFFVNPAELEEWPPTPRGADPEPLEEAVRFVEQQGEDGPINITTPRDIGTYFTSLLAGTVVNPEVSASILEILGNQVVDDRFPCFLPLGTAMAHKTGNLDHVVHDAGVIWGASGPMVLVAMVEDPDDDLVATWIIQRLALIAYDSSVLVPPMPSEGTAVPDCFAGIPE